MKPHLILSWTLTLLALLAPLAHAQVPNLVNYQGRIAGALTTDNGDERTVTDTSAAGPREFYRIEVQKP